jgi:hypothetical protein
VDNRVRAILLLGSLIAFTSLGCSGLDMLVAYTGGGLPPGDEDTGGVVVAELPDGDAAPDQATTPVPGAEVLLFRGVGMHQVGTAITGDGGYFRFERPDSGWYLLRVNPPEGSGLLPAETRFKHTGGTQTFLTITLQRQE